jgi:hypothetical protein
MIVAPGGVFYSGEIDLGDFGFGAIFGSFHNTGRFKRAVPTLHSYAEFASIPPNELFLIAGSGGGGQGGEGQMEVSEK